MFCCFVHFEKGFLIASTIRALIITVTEENCVVAVKKDLRGNFKKSSANTADYHCSLPTRATFFDDGYRSLGIV